MRRTTPCPSSSSFFFKAAATLLFLSAPCSADDPWRDAEEEAQIDKVMANGKGKAVVHADVSASSPSDSPPWVSSSSVTMPVPAGAQRLHAAAGGAAVALAKSSGSVTIVPHAKQPPTTIPASVLNSKDATTFTPPGHLPAEEQAALPKEQTFVVPRTVKKPTVARPAEVQHESELLDRDFQNMHAQLKAMKDHFLPSASSSASPASSDSNWTKHEVPRGTPDSQITLGSKPDFVVALGGAGAGSDVKLVQGKKAVASAASAARVGEEGEKRGIQMEQMKENERRLAEVENRAATPDKMVVAMAGAAASDGVGVTGGGGSDSGLDKSAATQLEKNEEHLREVLEQKQNAANSEEAHKRQRAKAGAEHDGYIEADKPIFFDKNGNAIEQTKADEDYSPVIVPSKQKNRKKAAATTTGDRNSAKAKTSGGGVRGAGKHGSSNKRAGGSGASSSSPPPPPPKFVTMSTGDAGLSMHFGDKPSNIAKIMYPQSKQGKRFIEPKFITRR